MTEQVAQPKGYFVMIHSEFIINQMIQKEVEGEFIATDGDLFYGSISTLETDMSVLRNDVGVIYDLSDDVFYLQEVVGNQV